MGTTLHRGARASHYRGLSRCGAQAPDAQAQQLWLTGLVAPQHVGIFPDQGSNPRPLHWQADSQPLRHQGSPFFFFNLDVSLKTTVGWGWWCAELGDWDWHIYTDVYKIDDWLKKNEPFILKFLNRKKKKCIYLYYQPKLILSSSLDNLVCQVSYYYKTENKQAQ